MAKPIFCVTHPRACSTAFERVFMTRTDDLTCVHEPFGDAFYFGPERLSSRYEDDSTARGESGFSDSTFKSIFDRLADEQKEGKRLFIKDIIHYLFPPNASPVQLAPSLDAKRRGIGTTAEVYANGTTAAPYPYPTQQEGINPTVVPDELLRQFHFTFLIRDPHSSIPSYWRCTIPPLDRITGFYDFYPSEAGYDEVRRMFDYLVGSSHVGPVIAGQGGKQFDKTSLAHLSNGSQTNGVAVNGDSKNNAEICVVDADDLLDDPEAVVREYCRSVGLDYKPSMLVWDTEESHQRAKAAFEKWKGFHEDAINSTDLKPRTHKKTKKTEEQWDAEWKEKYGEAAAKIIRETVDKNMPDYLYLKQYAIRV